ncbi:Leucine-rich repeat-containing protein 15 [Halotydeus destructor]|nr:Leucine-rich repeat-containing protein 15 [Halotydeus destructor]
MEQRGLRLSSHLICKLLLLTTLSLVCPETSRTSGRVLVSGHCPNKCQCTAGDATVNCSAAALGMFPIMLNPRLETLDISNNGIRKLTSADLAVYPKVRTLLVASNELRVLVDNAFAAQGHLKVLNLAQNSISSLSVSSFNGLNSLEQLKLNHNKIENITESIFHKMSKLKELDLRRNQMNALSEVAFLGLNSLQSLNLAQNNVGTAVYPSKESDAKSINRISAISLTKDKPAVILSPSGLSPEVVPQLQVLDLSQNGFTHILRSWSPFAQRGCLSLSGGIVECTERSGNGSDSRLPSSAGKSIMALNSFLWWNLQDVSLNGCFIEFIEESSFEGLPSLLHLKLHDNSLTAIPSHIFKDIKRLEVLTLGGNKFTSIESNAFLQLSNLKQLDMSKCKRLETIKAGAFNGLVNLERLDLSFNVHLSSLHVSSFQGLNSLKYLSLQGNNMTTMAAELISPLSSHSNLRLLDIRHNSIECNCQIGPLRDILIGLKDKSRAHSAALGGRGGHDGPNLDTSGPTTMATTGPGMASLRPDEEPLFEWSREAPKGKGRKSRSAPSRSVHAIRGTVSQIADSEAADEAANVLDVLDALNVLCSGPKGMRGRPVMGVDTGQLGCRNVGWLAVTVGVILVSILTMLAAIFYCVRKRKRSRVLSKGIYIRNPSIGTSGRRSPIGDKLANRTTLASNQKLFGLNSRHHQQSPIYDIDQDDNDDDEHIYAKPEFIVQSSEKVDINGTHHHHHPYHLYARPYRQNSKLNDYDEEDEVRRSLSAPFRAVPSTDL